MLAVILIAAKFGAPVCPHAGGAELREYVQQYAMLDYICTSASLENRMVEYADHFHEHFVHPVVVKNGRYMPPQAPGFSITMRPESLDAYECPLGTAWQARDSLRGGITMDSETDELKIETRHVAFKRSDPPAS